MKSKSRASEKWSRKFDRCICCDSTEYRHEAKGECVKCYKTNRKEKYNSNARFRYNNDPDYRSKMQSMSMDWKTKNRQYTRDYAVARYYDDPESERIRVNERNHGGNWLEVLIRDRFICQRCMNEAELVHHKDGVGEDHSIDSQVSLCKGCHTQIHLTNNLPEEDLKFFI